MHVFHAGVELEVEVQPDLILRHLNMNVDLTLFHSYPPSPPIGSLVSHVETDPHSRQNSNLHSPG